MKYSRLLLLASSLWLGTAPLVSTFQVVVAQESSSSTSQQTNKTTDSPATNLYQYVNHEWLEQTELPGDTPSVDAFSEVNDQIEELLKNDVQKMIAGELIVDDIPEIQKFLDFYAVATNFDRRESEGTAVAQPYIDKINQLTDLTAFQTQFAELSLTNYPLPFDFGIGADLENAQENILYLAAPNVLLPDKSNYDDSATREAYLKAYTDSSLAVLKAFHYTDEEAKKLMDDTIAFDQLLLPYIMTRTEKASIDNTYHKINLNALDNYSKNINLRSIVKSLTGQEPDQIVVDNPAYFEALDTILTEENLPLLRAWMTVKFVRSISPYTTDEARLAAEQYSMALYGTTEPKEKDEAAYDVAYSKFDEAIGLYYGRTYFGDAARQDVTNMINDIVAAYKERLSQNDWLSQTTITEAIKKLDNLGVYVGYPDKLPAVYQQIVIDQEKSLLDNVVAMNRLAAENNVAQLGQPADHSDWGMGAQEVNAFYSAQTNSIYFPAGVLQAPFYSADQSASQNFGGIGAVIGHEISHAFDSEGSRFNEYGDLKNWWTEEDHAAFKAKTQAMIDQWDGREFAGTKVNGQLTVTENTADAGGISVAYEVLAKRPDANPAEFFESWAKVWRQKATPAYLKLVTETDEHAPSELRANVQPQNLDAFYETFNIKEGDPMYLAPEKRVKIW